jgi:hypothetical protein
MHPYRESLHGALMVALPCRTPWIS